MKRPVAQPNAARPAPRALSPAPVPAQKPEAEEDLPPHPNLRGSIWCLVGLAATAFFLHGQTPVDVARFGAIGVLLSLGISIAMDLRLGVQNLVRTDLMALMALYFLTLAEFLGKQSQYNWLAAVEPTRIATLACICSYAGLIVGRHLIKPRRAHIFAGLFQEPVPPAALFTMFWLFFLIGYLYMLMSVDFNVVDMVKYFMEPRFYQPWGRGRLGDWKAMLYETGMILYLVPPLGGVLLARRRKFSKFAVFLVSLGVLFTLFYGLSSGTRNVFDSYLVTFLIGFCFAANRKQVKEIVIIGLLSAVALVVSTKVMLDFRDQGLMDYVVHGNMKPVSPIEGEQSLAVDNNLYAISRLTEYFPRHHDYTWFEQPYLALIHPIPRVLWPGKPQESSISVENIVGANGWTVATSVVGEEYMMHGCVAAFFMSVFFGVCCAWWNRLASPKNSEFGILVYASGFFSVVITMRSMNWSSTALLPTLAGLGLGYIYLSRLARNRARWRAQDARVIENRRKFGPRPA